MPFTWPYVTDTFVAYLAESRETSLSLAVWLVDEYTQGSPVGAVEVAIIERTEKPVRNLSGYYLFNGLPNGVYTVCAKSDFYLDRERSALVPGPDPKSPVISIVLKPKPSYPFPANATLVRGVLVNAQPVAGAEVTVIAKPEKTITDGQGEFVLFFKGIKKELITIEIKKGGDTKPVTVTIEEGKTVSTGIIHFP